MARDLPVPYAPALPPYITDAEDRPPAAREELENVVRYINEELHRVADSLAQDTIALSVTEDVVEAIDGTFDWIRIFEGATPGWDLPGGSWDSVLAVYTVPVRGLYSINIQSTVQPFGSGNKNYYAGLALDINPGPGSPTVADRIEAFSGGADDVPLGVALNGSIPLYSSDTLYVEWGAVHEQFSGLSDVKHLMQLAKV